MAQTEKVKIFLLGIIVVIGMFLLLRGTSSSNDIGRYQLSMPGTGPMVMHDTKTGVVKAVFWGAERQFQLGIPFERMEYFPPIRKGKE
jgi:hypothetical protein